MRANRLQKFVGNANSLVLALANLLVAAVFGYLGHLYLGGSLTDGPPVVAAEFVDFCSFVIFTIAFLVSYILEFDLKMREEFAGFSERLHSIENAGNIIECVGTAFNLFDNRFQQLREAADRATLVRNTLVFHYADNPEEVEASLDEYLAKGGPKRQQLLATVLGNGNDWDEIFSRNVARKFDGLIRSVKNANAASYRPLVMKKGIPVVNFALFKGPGAEVWFGFGLLSGNVKGNVFRSTNVELIEYFDRYFTELAKECTAWSGIDQESFYGIWITAVYQDNKLKDCARLAIYAERNTIVVRGEIYAFDAPTGKFTHLHDFISEDKPTCVLENGNLKLQFGISNDTSVDAANRQVECCYEIMNFHKPDCFIGTAKVNLANPTRIFGHKLNAASHGRLSNASHAETAQFLGSLFEERHIRSQPPLPNQSPFSGSAFS